MVKSKSYCLPLLFVMLSLPFPALGRQRNDFVVDVGMGVAGTLYRSNSKHNSGLFGVTPRIGAGVTNIGGSAFYGTYALEFFKNNGGKTLWVANGRPDTGQPGIPDYPYVNATHCPRTCTLGAELRHSFGGGAAVGDSLIGLVFSTGRSAWAVKRPGPGLGEAVFTFDSSVDPEVAISSAYPSYTDGDRAAAQNGTDDPQKGNSWTLGGQVMHKVKGPLFVTAGGEYYRTHYGVNVHQNNWRATLGVNLRFTLKAGLW